jgi:hypothetical protein
VSLSTRTLLRAATAAAAICWPATASPLGAAELPGMQLRIVMLLPGAAADSADFHRGAVMGAEEAGRAATLLGHSLELDVLSWGEGERLPQFGEAAAVVAALDCSRLLRVAEVVAPTGTAVLNVACAADSVRLTGCHPSIFHIVASEAMHGAAARMVEASGEGSSVAAFPPRSDAGQFSGFITGWDPRLYRFGAEQLNDRYAARFGGGMTYEAWTAWLAVKAAWEAAARSGSERRLSDHLRQWRDRFDGHKGVALDFRPWDHQLRQPLYYVAATDNGDTRIIDVPPRGSGAVRSMLDQLGTSAAEMRCGSNR